MSKRDARSRVWTFIVYPESAPKNWRDLLDSQHVAWVESPLHDQDINPDGTKKKPHWHIIFFYEGKKSYEQVKALTDMVSAPIPQKVPSPKGLVRYLVHLDNPEKFQYKREDIKCHCGADIETYFELSMSARNVVLRDLMEFISESEIDNFDDLVMYCIRQKEYDWFDIAVNKNTLAINKQLDAIYQRKHPKKVSNGTNFDDKVTLAKEMAKNGAKRAVIADTLGVSKSTVMRYLRK